jgi:hypothetical protein
VADWLKDDSLETAVSTARAITAEVLDSSDLDDPEDLLHPLAEAFRIIDRAGLLP